MLVTRPPSRVVFGLPVCPVADNHDAWQQRGRALRANAP
jgi:hypothetical protein